MATESPYIGYRSAGRRPESQQDRRASADAPLAALRGMISGVLGAPGDIESLFRLLPYINRETVLPTSEDVAKRLPLREVSETPVGRAATFGGQLAGGTYMGPGSPLRAIAALPSAVRRAGQDFAMAAGQPAVNVVKQKGGNWLAGSIDEALRPLKQRAAPEQVINASGVSSLKEFEALSPEERLLAYNKASASDPLNRWIDKKLGRYIQNEMATPEDPLRALIQERGVSHTSIDDLMEGSGWTPDEVVRARKRGGFPEEGMAEALHASRGYPEGLAGDRARAASGWEAASDAAVSVERAGDLLRLGETSPTVRANPWLSKVDPDAPVYSLDLRGGDLDISHILDELHNATNPESGLPRELLLKYSDLDKVTVPQAVERVAKINEWRAAQKVLADSARANNAATQVFKEYPDKGYKWVELTADKADEAKAKALADALKYEGETMGHCVGGYCPDVLEGRSRIYSLRDAKGQPHVTVEVAPSAGEKDYPEQLWKRWQKQAEAEGLGDEDAFNRVHDLAENWARSQDSNRIVQIKGKANRAPNPEYLPFVQDFVRSGKWADVGDLGNAGMKRLADFGDEPMIQQARQKYGDFITNAEWEELMGGAQGLQPPKPEPGFAQGGSVNLDDLYAKYAEGGNVTTTLKGPSAGVLGFLGVRPEQYDQARALINAGISSLNNADRLSYVSPEQRARLQSAADAGLTYLNGDALVPGGPGAQNPDTPTFYTPTDNRFGGVQAQPSPQAPQVGGGAYNPQGPGQVVNTPGQPGVYTPPGLPTAQTPPAQAATDGVGGLGGQQPYRPPSVYAPVPNWSGQGSFFPINYNPAKIQDIVAHLQSQMYV